MLYSKADLKPESLKWKCSKIENFDKLEAVKVAESRQPLS